MLDYLRVWELDSARLNKLMELVVSELDERSAAVLALSGLRLLAPLPNPASLRDGYAFRQHVETMRRNRGAEMIAEFDHFPVFYFGNHRTIFGPGPFPVQKLHLDRLDYELELAIVIGKSGINIPANRADEHIFGMTIMNDMSARGLQTEEMKLSLGPAKGKDFGTVLGPVLVTMAELASVSHATPVGRHFDLKMQASVNGKLLSEGNANKMTWSFAQIVERASYGVRLNPGDVIGSGTVGTGCLAELNSSKVTDNLWLQPGDRVVLTVDQLGQLETEITVGNESYAAA